MTCGLLGAYKALASNKCSENKCCVILDNSLLSYCGEKLRDSVQGFNRASPSPVCDCFISSPNDCISIVELKHYSGRSKCISVGRVRKQLCGGFGVLCKILRDQQKHGVSVQFVLCTNGKFQFSSERLKFQKPILTNASVQIAKICCGSKLPSRYTKIKIDHVTCQA